MRSERVSVNAVGNRAVALKTEGYLGMLLNESADMIESMIGALAFRRVESGMSASPDCGVHEPSEHLATEGVP